MSHNGYSIAVITSFLFCFGDCIISKDLWLATHIVRTLEYFLMTECVRLRKLRHLQDNITREMNNIEINTLFRTFENMKRLVEFSMNAGEGQFQHLFLIELFWFKKMFLYIFI